VGSRPRQADVDGLVSDRQMESGRSWWIGGWMCQTDGWTDGRMGMETQTDGYGVGARQIRIEKWVGWQTNRQMDGQIGCEIDKNRWGVGQKVALGQQVGGMGGRTDGGMCGQLLEGDGSPGWVDDDPKQAHACAKTRKFDEVGEKAELLGEHMADRRWHWGHMTKKIAQMDNGGWW